MTLESKLHPKPGTRSTLWMIEAKNLLSGGTRTNAAKKSWHDCIADCMSYPLNVPLESCAFVPLGLGFF